MKNSLKKYRTNKFFSKTSALIGAGSIMNISGNYFRNDYTKLNRNIDGEAIANDWGIIAGDIKKVLENSEDKID